MKLLHRLPDPATDLGLLIARVALGIVLVAHGWQKVSTFGIDGVATSFEQMDIPAATAAATFAAVVELGGGILLIAGVLMPLVAALVVVDMAGAFWFAHRGTEVFVTEGGWELVAVIAAGALALAATGPGRLSVGHLVGGRSTA